VSPFVQQNAFQTGPIDGPPGSWLSDLVAQLEVDGVGVYGEDIFTSTKSSPPILPNGEATLSVVATGGTSPEKTHNSVIRPAYVRPGAQLTARARDYTTAEAKAQAAYDSLVKVRNVHINSGWYMSIDPLQEPFDGGTDERGQSQCQFNVIGRKRSHSEPY
jgi:hypothetical protein